MFVMLASIIYFITICICFPNLLQYLCKNRGFTFCARNFISAKNKNNNYKQVFKPLEKNTKCYMEIIDKETIQFH